MKKWEYGIWELKSHPNFQFSVFFYKIDCTKGTLTGFGGSMGYVHKILIGIKMYLSNFAPITQLHRKHSQIQI